MELNGIFNNPSKFVPGPGQYPFQSSLDGQKYSFRPRTKDPSVHVNHTPGPGQYPFYNTINKFGKYVLSKLENSRASNFNPPHSQRFPISSTNLDLEQYQNINPGPGAYSMKIMETSSNGSYSLAGIENSKVRSFSHSQKNGGLGGIYQNCKEASSVYL